MNTNTTYSGRVEEAQKIGGLLTKAGVAVKGVSVCGRNVVVTARSRDTADKAAQLIGGAFELIGIRESREEAVINKNTMLRPTMVTVWRVMARA